LGLQGTWFLVGSRRKEGRDKSDGENRWSRANKFILGLTDEKAMEIMQNH
jgi:hypothetical protein